MTTLNKPAEADSVGRPVYSQTFPCEPSTAEMGRTIVRGVLGVWQLDSLVDRAALIVTELIANAVSHTPCREIRLIVGRPTPSRVRVGVVDREPSCLPALSQAEVDDESGRGLLLIDAVADRWGCDLRGSGTRPWGKEVWAELRSNGDACPPGKLRDGQHGRPTTQEREPPVKRQWISGHCWLGCERTGVRVIWLGPVQWDGQHAPFYACEPCLERLKARALAHFMAPQPASA